MSNPLNIKRVIRNYSVEAFNHVGLWEVCSYCETLQDAENLVKMVTRDYKVDTRIVHILNQQKEKQ